MKATTLGVLMGAALVAACFVERPSHAFECTTATDCAGFEDNRTCKGGYCVVQSCPAGCDVCDEDARSCGIDCSSAEDCGSVTCPPGWTCTIECSGTGACGSISCATTSRCDVVCTGTGACGSTYCETGSRCDVVCTGTGACGNLICAEACKCDLTCATGACGTPECPVVGNGANAVHCTADGTDTGPCDSARDAGCTKC
jgi:hypothetical protein